MSRAYNQPTLLGTALLVLSGPVNLVSFSARLNGTGASYIQCFNAAAAADVVVGTTAAVAVFGSATLADVSMQFTDPLYFGQGLVVAATTTATGSTAVNTGVNLVMVIQ